MEDSTSKPPVEKPSNGIPPEDTSQNERRRSQWSVQLPPQIEPAPKRESNSYYGKPDPTPLWKIILEVSVGLAVIGYAYVAARQLKMMHAAYGQIQEQTAKITQQAVAAQQSLELARQFQPRPWIGPKGNAVTIAGPKFLAGSTINPVVAELQLSSALYNYGSSPALRVTTVNWIVFSETEGNPPTDQMSKFMLVDSCKAANPSANMPTVYILPSEESSVSPLIEVALPDNIKVVREIWISYCIAYVGVSETPHHTRLLYHSVPQSGVAPIPVLPNSEVSYIPISQWYLWSAEAD